MNLTEGGQNNTKTKFIANLLLSVANIGISSHFWILPFTIDSRFAIIQVFDMSATVKSQESLDLRHTGSGCTA